MWVGADRIAANGDVANKIGTYSPAVLAHYHGIPFYVAAPHTTHDPHCPDGAAIPIEQRGGRSHRRFRQLRRSPVGAERGTGLQSGVRRYAGQAHQRMVSTAA